MELVRILSAQPDASGKAQHSMLALEGRVPPDRLDEVRLVVSELVTNVLEHAGLKEWQSFMLRLEVSSRGIRVEVIDRGVGFGDIPDGHGDQQGGGLAIVQWLADEWGRENGSETKVWAEFDSSQ